MKVYQALLGEEAKYESLAEKIEEAVKVVTDKMNEIQPGVPNTTTAKKAGKAPVAGKARAGGTVVAAVLQVLVNTGKAMTSKEIMDEAVKLGLYSSDCAAPYEAFVSSFTKAMAKGEKRIKRIGRGIYQIAA